MKVLFDHQTPFNLAHGGFQTQIEQTKAALESIGVEVEYMRWWDDQQRGDLIHFFGRPLRNYISLAHHKNLKIVVGDLLTGLGSRHRLVRLLQKTLMHATRAMLPEVFTFRLGWETYQVADACVALTRWEAHLMREMFSAPAHKTRVIPNGVEEEFLSAPPAARGPWLICTAAITERKRVVEAAEAAVVARTPLWIVGKAYGDSDAYARKFLEIARAHPDLIRYEGPIQDRQKLAQAYRQARGFVLLSTQESLSLSALEAAACQCPLLLTDLPWARTTFGTDAHYCPLSRSASRTASTLRHFYDAAPKLPAPPMPKTWSDVARMFRALYEELLTTSR